MEGRFQNGADALRESAHIHPQAAFIDIEMPEMDGLTLAEKLLESDPDMKIVFITGWNQYAVAAFELNALDYIMKPVNRVRFEKMAQRLQKKESNRRSPADRRFPAGRKGRCAGSSVAARLLTRRVTLTAAFLAIPCQSGPSVLV